MKVDYSDFRKVWEKWRPRAYPCLWEERCYNNPLKGFAGPGESSFEWYRRFQRGKLQEYLACLTIKKKSGSPKDKHLCRNDWVLPWESYWLYIRGERNRSGVIVGTPWRTSGQIRKWRKDDRSWDVATQVDPRLETNITSLTIWPLLETLLCNRWPMLEMQNYQDSLSSVPGTCI